MEKIRDIKIDEKNNKVIFTFDGEPDFSLITELVKQFLKEHNLPDDSVEIGIE